MSDEEFNRLLEELIGGLPVTLVVSRLTLLVRALVESAGTPGEDMLRAMVHFHDYPPQTGPQGHPTGDHLQDLAR